MSRTAEVVVIGGGVMGVSIAFHLARRGCSDVIVLEKQDLPGNGSTGRCAGGIRHQFSTAVNIELSKMSIHRFRNFRQETGQDLDVKICGYLFLLDNPKDLSEFRKNVALQRSRGVNSEILDLPELSKLVPDINLEGITAGVFCPDDGLADPGGVVTGYARKAAALGVRILLEIPVLGLEIRSGEVRAVVTPEGPLYSPRVVIAAGPWSAGIAKMAGVDLPVLPVRRQLAITCPIPGLRQDFPFVVDFSRSLYFHAEGGGILTGMSNPSQEPGFFLEVDEEWRSEHLENAVRRLPLLQGADLLTEWAGLYEVTPDHQPILGAVPSVKGLYACTGFSGHGFMHSPACGLLMAEEILEGSAGSIDIDSLRLQRFSRQTGEPEYNVV